MTAMLTVTSPASRGASGLGAPPRKTRLPAASARARG
ncbi:Uncharacterised protein [Bordetella pertussis]|nr:Uncharacterised protein [Bordetella pertussis]